MSYRHLALVLSRVMPLLALSITLSACGGGGGGGDGGAPPSAVGSYFYFGGNVRPDPLSDVTEWGSMVLDETTATLTTKVNNGTGVLPFLTDGVYSYSIDANRNFTTEIAGLPSTGRMSASGKLINMSYLHSSTNGTSNNHFAIRIGGTHSAASLAETYAIFMIVPGRTVWWGHITFDGVSAFTGDMQATDGIQIAPQSINGTYSVAADGGLTWAFGGSTYEGMVGEGGDFVGIAGGVSNGDLPVYALLVRRAPGTFSGAYAERSLGFDGVTSVGYSHSASVVVDGVGGFSLTGTRKEEDGSLTPLNSSSNTYSVASDGALTMAIGGSGYWGYIVDGGGIAIYAGPTAVPADPRLSVLIR